MSYKSDKENAELSNKWFELIYAQLGWDCERIYDDTEIGKQMQIDGIDVVLTKGDRTMLVDEKSSMSYLMKDCNSQCLELISHDYWSGKTQLGWALKGNKTTHYAFAFPKARSLADYKDGKCTSFELFLVDSAKLKKRLEDILLIKFEDIPRFWARVSQQITPNQWGHRRYTIAKGYVLVESTQLRECPLNLTISHDVLKEVCDIHAVIKENRTILLTNRL